MEVSIDNIEEDAFPGRIQHWLSQQCRFGLKEKELPGLYGPEELSLVNHRDSYSTFSEEAALRADSPLLGFGIEDERSLMDPLHFPSPTYVRDLPDFYYRSPSSHSRSTSTSSSSRRKTLGSSLSRRPSLLRKPSLPFLGELDNESQPQAISSPPQPSRSRTESNASSFQSPTLSSIQLSRQISPLTPISPPPFVWRRSRKPNTPSLLSFDSDSPGGVRSRPPSQLHHGVRLPLPQKIPHTLSRSSSSLSLLSLSTNNRNAVYIDEMIDIESGVDDYLVENGEYDRLQAMNEEGYHIPPTPNSDGFYFNGLTSSQVYLGIRTKAKPPTRPPPAPPLIIDADEKGGLGGIGVIDEDAMEEKLREANSHHRQPHPPSQQRIQSEATGVRHHESDFDADTHVNLDSEGFISRWSLTSSVGEIPTFAGAFGVGGSGGGGLFGSRKRMSFGVDKMDKAKGILGEGKEKEDEEKEKEKAPKFAERLLAPIEKEKEREKNTDKKKSRLVSFISRISSNMIASPATTSQNAAVIRSSSY